MSASLRRFSEWFNSVPVAPASAAAAASVDPVWEPCSTGETSWAHVSTPVSATDSRVAACGATAMRTPVSFATAAAASATATGSHGYALRLTRTNIVVRCTPGRNSYPFGTGRRTTPRR